MSSAVLAIRHCINVCNRVADHKFCRFECLSIVSRRQALTLAMPKLVEEPAFAFTCSWTGHANPLGPMQGLDPGKRMVDSAQLGPVVGGRDKS